MNLHTPTSWPLVGKLPEYKPTVYIALVWRAHELAFIEDFDNLTVAVEWASKQVAIDHAAGYVNTSASIAPKECES